MLDIALIDSGNPWQNASADRFNGLFSGEGLSMDWFRFRVEGEVVINQLRRHYIGGRSRYNFNDMALRLWSDGQEQPEYGDHP